MLAIITITLLILLLVPAKLSKLLSRSLLGWLWRGSTLKMVVEAGGKKLSSFKDVELTKKNKEEASK